MKKVITLHFNSKVVLLGIGVVVDFTLETHIYDADDGERLKEYHQEVVSGGLFFNVNLPLSGVLKKDYVGGYYVDKPVYNFFVELRWYKSW